MSRFLACALAFATLLIPTSVSAQHPVNPDLHANIGSLDIAPVWSGHPVGFSLLTHGNQQYAAFYAADRRMTIAQRTLGQRRWTLTALPSTVGWDSHNAVTMALDSRLRRPAWWSIPPRFAGAC